MRLVKISRGQRRWEVLGIATDAGNCQVLDFLFDQIQGKLIPEDYNSSFESACTQMLAWLREEIPTNGPPTREPASAPLGDGLMELRKNRKGKKLRVSWFYDGQRIIVCVLAFSKRSKRETTPPDAVARSKKLMRRYFTDKAQGQNRIDPIR